MSQRPFFGLSALGFMAGMLLERGSADPGTWTLLCIGTLGTMALGIPTLVALGVLRNQNWIAGIAYYLCFVPLGAVYGFLNKPMEPLGHDREQLGLIQIERVFEGSKGYWIQARLHQGDLSGSDIPFYWVRNKAQDPPKAGEVYGIKARIVPDLYAKDRWQFKRAYLGPLQLGFPGKPMAHVPPTPGMQDLVRARVQRSVRLLKAGPDAKGLVLGLVLGDRTLLSDSFKQTMARAGVAHILAVSGLHVGLVGGLLLVLLRLAGNRNKTYTISALLITGLMVWFYVWITGSGPPAVRAATLFSLFLFSRMLQRSVATLNILGLAALLELLLRPQNLYSASFQLSYSAVWILLFSHQYLYQEPLAAKGPRSWFRSSARVSCWAWMGTLPFTLYWFGQVSWVFLPANLVVLPFMPVILLLSMGIALCAALKLSGQAQLLLTPLEFGIQGMQKLMEWLNSLTPQHWSAHTLSAREGIWMAVLVLSFMLIRIATRWVRTSIQGRQPFSLAWTWLGGIGILVLILASQTLPGQGFRLVLRPDRMVELITASERRQIPGPSHTANQTLRKAKSEACRVGHCCHGSDLPFHNAYEPRALDLELSPP